MKVNFLVIYILKFIGEKKIVNFSFENENYIKKNIRYVWFWINRIFINNKFGLRLC